MENRAAEIHDGLKHPVIDGDGHWMEPIPIFLEYLREVGGAGSVDQMRALWRRKRAWYRATWQERQHNRLRRTIWWGVTSNTLDKATALLPALLNERLPELGIDFALIYPSFGLTHQRHCPGRPAPGRGPRLQHDDGRHVRAVCRKVCAGSDHPRPYAGRSDRGAGIRGQAAGLQSDHAAGKPGAADPERGGRNRSAEGRLVLRYHRPRQPL